MEGKTNPWWVLCILFFISFSLNSRFSSGADTISGNQSLSGAQTIVSSRGDFALGFFKPGNSSKYYIGMWYNKVSQQTVVWVANREKPVGDPNSSALRISDGNLVLFNESQVPIWSTNVGTAGSSSVEAVLGDDGNLVLRNGPNSTFNLWESFNFPAHTWLPGMKMKLDKRTNKSQLLTSWRNSEDPAPGLFSLELDPNGTNEYIIRWNKAEQYWTSGPWNGKIFSLVPEMRLNYIYNFNYVSNANESYFTYSLYDSSIISRFVMDISGQIKQLSWLESTKQWNLFWSQPRQQCEVYAFCGAFGSCNEKGLPFCNCSQGFDPKRIDEWNLTDYSGGCVRRTPLQCPNATLPNERSDKFWESPNMRLPEHPQAATARSIKECESACLGDCNCTAYGYENNECTLWHGDLLNLQQLADGDNTGKTIYIRLATSEFPSSKSNKAAIIGAIGGSVGLLLFALVVFVILRQRKRTIKIAKAGEGSLVAFGYRDLQNATKNFSEKLGGGGFGSVFKGTLSDSTVIAVKKLESISQGEKQFRTEVSTIGTIQHVNLVRLRGFCSEGIKKLLVYDYMPNGSLDTHLFHEKDSKVLDWETRYKIALGTARGLVYLHEKCRDCIIHCDIKPENILLDAEFCPKVADFGLAKLVGRDFSRVLTTMRGTRGYLAPEWISGVAITAKADVYSYGMMLFECVSGTRNSEHTADGKVRFFPTWAASIVSQGGDVLSLLDPRLDGNANVEELSRICKVACWCIQDDETHRPSMGQVVQILEGILDVNLPPIPRSLQVFVDNQEHIIFFTESSSSQSSQKRSNASTASSQTNSATSSTNR
ncbi:hypothetical protein SLA2020_217620 [Shorea laevis]